MTRQPLQYTHLNHTENQTMNIKFLTLAALSKHLKAELAKLHTFSDFGNKDAKVKAEGMEEVIELFEATIQKFNVFRVSKTVVNAHGDEVCCKGYFTTSELAEERVRTLAEESAKLLNSPMIKSRLSPRGYAIKAKDRTVYYTIETLQVHNQ